MKYSKNNLKENIDKHNFNFKKMYGQNFIVDENTINNIVSSADISSDTLVIEIGPGGGALTYKLSKVAKCVACYEIDTTLKYLLEENLSDTNNVNVIYKDFLKADVKADLKEYTYEKLYVVANLPYYITTPILMKFIQDEIPVDKIVIMVQKEVGDRFNAKVGSKEYNSLSIYLNYYFDIKKLLDVSRNVFMPKPNVDSIVVELSKKQIKYDLKNKEIFFKLIKDSFTQKRKTIKNNLKDYDLNIVEEVLRKYNFDLSVRAERLSIEVFVDIANSLCK